MKLYTEIMQEIANNSEQVKELEAQADILFKKAEVAAADSIKEKIAIHKSITPEEDAAAVKLLQEAETLKSVNTILSENVKASFFDYVTPIIKSIMQKYNGKQYGTKTKEKIREEAKSHGIMFYFDGYRDMTSIHVYCLTSEGYKAYNAPEIVIHGIDSDNHYNAFISESNKIQDINTIIFSASYRYTEDPAAKITALNKAYEEYKRLLEQAAAAESKLNSMLPDKVKKFDAVGHLSPWQKPY